MQPLLVRITRCHIGSILPETCLPNASRGAKSASRDTRNGGLQRRSGGKTRSFMFFFFFLPTSHHLAFILYAFAVFVAWCHAMQPTIVVASGKRVSPRASMRHGGAAWCIVHRESRESVPGTRSVLGTCKVCVCMYIWQSTR